MFQCIYFSKFTKNFSAPGSGVSQVEAPPSTLPTGLSPNPPHLPVDSVLTLIKEIDEL